MKKSSFTKHLASLTLAGVLAVGSLMPISATKHACPTCNGKYHPEEEYR